MPATVAPDGLRTSSGTPRHRRSTHRCGRANTCRMAIAHRRAGGLTSPPASSTPRIDYGNSLSHRSKVISRLLAESVAEVGLQSPTFDNGLDALVVMLKEPFSVPLDVDMPGMDGHRLPPSATTRALPPSRQWRTGHEDSPPSRVRSARQTSCRSPQRAVAVTSTYPGPRQGA